MMAILISERYL